MNNKYDPIMQKLQYWCVKDNAPVVSEKDVSEFEDEIGMPLPADYRTFLLKYGYCAGEPHVQHAHANDPNGSRGGVGVFFGLRPGDKDAWKDSHDLRYNSRVFKGRIPRRLLPFADSPGGRLCLSLEGADAGRVYWWEQNALPGETDENLIFVAYDFDSFMNSLFRTDD